MFQPKLSTCDFRPILAELAILAVSHSGFAVAKIPLRRIFRVMESKPTKTIPTLTEIRDAIVVIDGRPVVLDYIVKRFYGRSTKAINQAVKRNAHRFPDSKCFRLTAEQWRDVSQNGTGYQPHRDMAKPPRAFTEKGIYQLAQHLRGPRADAVSELILDVFAAWNRGDVYAPKPGDGEAMAVVQNIPVAIDERLRNLEEQIKRSEHRDLEILAFIKSIGASRRRAEPKKAVRATHTDFVRQRYGGRCPCCDSPVFSDSGLPTGEIDHYSDRGNASLGQTWYICGECNRDLYSHQSRRSEVLGAFSEYQRRLTVFRETNAGDPDPDTGNLFD